MIFNGVNSKFVKLFDVIPKDNPNRKEKAGLSNGVRLKKLRKRKLFFTIVVPQFTAYKAEF